MENIKLGIIGALISSFIFILISDKKEVNVKKEDIKTEKDTIVLKKWI